MVIFMSLGDEESRGKVEVTSWYLSNENVKLFQ